MILVVAVHVTAGLDPVGRRLSEYVHEDTGWLMVGAFLMFGVALVALGSAIWLNRGDRAVVVASLVVAAGVGMILAGLYPTDTGALTTDGTIHSRGSGGATIALLAAAVLWSAGDATLKALTAAAIPLAFLSVVLHDTAASGLGQRLLWGVLTAWLLVAALRSGRQGARP